MFKNNKNDKTYKWTWSNDSRDKLTLKMDAREKYKTNLAYNPALHMYSSQIKKIILSNKLEIIQ